MFRLIFAIWYTFLEVLRFWKNASSLPFDTSIIIANVATPTQKLWTWYTSKKPTQVWLDQLRNAQTFEAWEEAACHLDNLLGLNFWRENPMSRDFQTELVSQRLSLFAAAQQERDLGQIINLVRSGLVRNLGSITSPKLYSKALGGTKLVIEDYVTQVAQAIEDITAWPLLSAANAPVAHASDESDGSTTARAVTPLTTQMKLDLIHDSRQTFGRTALVLQGGAIFGLCHLGVMKALLLRGLLPRIISGSATGALAAALVGTRREDDLLAVLRGDGIDLSAFAGKRSTAEAAPAQTFWTRFETLRRRVKRFRNEGYFLDVQVLEDCIRANVGELTFEEAYRLSGRILNITVPTAGREGVPILMNYLTTPHVLIWTAAVASNANSESFYGRRKTTILCRDPRVGIVEWVPADNEGFRKRAPLAAYSDRESPLHKVSSLFNVNHFIVSQARPYLIPFLQRDMLGPSLVRNRSRTSRLMAFLVRMVGLEVRHRLKQLDSLRVLPNSIRRFLVDEQVPGGSAMTLVPDVKASDFIRLLETPTRETLDYWILKGERSVWPAVAALRIRCAVEIELERSYQSVRTLRASGLKRSTSVAGSSQMPVLSLRKRSAAEAGTVQDQGPGQRSQVQSAPGQTSQGQNIHGQSARARGTQGQCARSQNNQGHQG
jgi:TAG lipase / lysophosphatidylethanolamine acyltransferase